MPVPDYQSLMLPALHALADGEETRIADVRKRVAAAQQLTPEDLREMLPSGKQPAFTNRVSWAVIYMARAGLVERVRRAVYRLTEEGERLLAQRPDRIDNSILRRYDAFARWKDTSNPPSRKDAAPSASEDVNDTPEEALDRAASRLQSSLEAEVLDRVRTAPPDFLEQVVIDLLIGMGYGGGDATKGFVTGGSGDGGIDGTVREDALGLDEVYVQAKKYAEGNTVGENALRNFAGAIDAAGTTKGVFVTTSTFTTKAREYLNRSPKRIVLIDGEELARLMVDYNVGVRTKEQYEIKRIDEDFFEQAGA